MNLHLAFSDCWKSVEVEHHKGQLVNSSTFVFAFLKTLSNLVPDLKYSYQRSSREGSATHPDLVIWAGDERPEVVFVGDFSFLPSSDQGFKRKLDFLQNAINKPVLDVLLNDDAAGEQLSKPLLISKQCEFGCFVIRNSGAINRGHMAATETIQMSNKSRFHNAYAIIPRQQNQRAEFKYITPVKVG